ncbi:protein TASOR 2 isoform X2 [Hemicordylus capensis]|uniref:protein TASOR 2 isoform X2 n=1 Tax=Hemicordylus capensis TaxID=884348 RepID=UPI0023036A77|nr:protein TASOR 2 isoform X2 [Hemicordylus capensis]
MAPLNLKSLTECKTKALYCAWKGQLFIQDQQVCDIALQSPFSGSIPAQLPARLEIRNAVRVSELRKKLPEAAFGKSNYANNEVHCQGILFSLYEVEILNQDKLKVDQLIESVKEKDLALIKYLNDRGILILLASSALLKEKGSDPDDSTCLQALFLISSPKPMALMAKDWKCEHRGHASPPQVTLALPALRYALVEAAKRADEAGALLSALVKSHIQDFAKLDKDALPASGQLDSLPLSFDLFLKKSDLEAVSEKCPPDGFSLLRLYFSDPSSYTLETSVATSSLGDDPPPPSSSEAACDAGSSSGFHSGSLPPDELMEMARTRSAAQGHLCSKDASVKSSWTGDQSLLWSKRKSSRLLEAGSRKQWPHMKVRNVLDSNKKWKKKKKKTLSPPSSRSLRSPTDSDEPTLKLKNLQYPLRRKRGAEVLSAEFVQSAKSELAAKAALASEGFGVEGKKPRVFKKHVKHLDGGKVEEKRNKKKQIKKKSASLDGIPLEGRREASNEGSPFSERTATQEACLSPRKDDYDSHALNMLADLALSSCNSPLMEDNNNNNRTGLLSNPKREHRRLQRRKVLCKSSDHEYHRITKKLKGTSAPHSPLSPRQPDQSADSPSSSLSRGCVSSGKRAGTRPSLTKTPVVLPKQTGDLLDLSTPSFISSEHSYASPVLDSSKEQPLLKGVPASPNSKNGVKNAKPRPLVGKVLPFRHQQNICHPQKPFKYHVPVIRSDVLAQRLKEDYKFRQVTFGDKTVKVTCRWEAEYLFSLDSRYTNNSLEKTVVRAIHGPWDTNLTDDVEEMKLILHMWVALFYSKPVRSPTVRKVVEHSNPAKYVSLNSIVDPLTLIDEGSYSLEKCPADSLSEANQMASDVEEMACSPSEKPLSCNELSSTNCIEDEAPLVNPEEPSDLPLEDEQVGMTTSNSEDTIPSFAKVPGGEPAEEVLIDPVVSANSQNSNSTEEHSAGCSVLEAEVDRSHVETEADQAVNLVEVSQSDSACMCTAFLEDSTDKQPVAGTETTISVENQEISNASSYMEEVEESYQPGEAKSLSTSKALWLEADAPCREDDSPCREGRDLPGLSMGEEEEDVDVDGESMELASIDLALSESNDTDLEPRDMDLDPESEEFPEEGCVTEEKETAGVSSVASSSDDSLFTLITSQAVVPVQQTVPKAVEELLGSQADAVELTPNSPSEHQTDLIEGFSSLQEDTQADSVLPQTSPLHQTTLDEETELPKIEESVAAAEHCISPNQMDWAEGSCVSQEDQGNNVADSPSELNEVQNDTATQAESVESKEEPLALEQHFTFPYSVGLFDVSSISEQGKGVSNLAESNLTDSDLQHASPVCQTIPEEVTDLPGNQEDSEVSTKPPASPNLVSLIEDISLEDFHLADSAPLQTCELSQIQDSVATETESIGNQKGSVVSARYLAPSEQMDVVESCSISQEEEVIHLTEATPLQADESHQAQNNTVTQEEEKARETPALLNVSPDEKEKHNLGMNNTESEANSDDEEACVEDENPGDSAVTQEVAYGGDKLNQVTVGILEDIRSLLSELIDTACALTAESEETCTEEKSDFNWMSSVTLECVTPPESDEESCTTGQLARTDPGLMVNEYFKPCSIFGDQETDSQATLKGQSQHRLTTHENMSSDQVEMVEIRFVQENGAGLAATDVALDSSCIEWTEMGTRSLVCKSPLAETPASSKDNVSTASILCKVDLGPLSSHEATTSDGEGQLREACSETLPCVQTELQTDYSSEESDLPMYEKESESLKLGGSENALDEQLASERAQLPSRLMGANTDLAEKSPSVGGDQELSGDLYYRSPSGSPRGTRFTDSPGVTEANYVCDLNPEEEICRCGDWMYLENKKKVSDVEFQSKPYDWPFVFRKDDRSILPCLDTDIEPGPLKYINFSVTKKHKDKSRTFHSSKRCDSFMGESGFINSLHRTWGVVDDPIQNTLDMECLRFHYKLKQTLASEKPQLSTSSPIFAKEFSPQAIAETLPLRKVPEVPALSPLPRSRSPLLVTIGNLGPRQSASHWHPRRSRYSDSPEPPPFAATQDSVGKTARLKSQGRGPFVPFHLNKLTYNNKLKDFRGDISVIMDEFAELSRVMKMADKQTSNKGRDPSTTSEDAPEKRCPPLPRRTASYEQLFTDLCSTLHFKLKNVAKEACKKPYMFYLVEMEDDPFFGRVKSLLKKGGHMETEPLHFLKASDPEADRLMVIIRNEDIFPHVYKIPSLLRLKHLPSVTFAGVDSPEDVLDHTSQELFHSGGFVVSDDQVLKSMTVGELKETVKTLEKLNGHGRWKWLLHYKETKKLLEDTRVEPAAHTKDLILRSCQGANITEVLHYHQCDSKSSPRSEYLNCLLNLQVQHISRRFAVFLTEKPSSHREALESKGILALDVNTFLATAEDMAMPFRGGY